MVALHGRRPLARLPLQRTHTHRRVCTQARTSFQVVFLNELRQRLCRSHQHPIRDDARLAKVGAQGQTCAATPRGGLRMRGILQGSAARLALATASRCCSPGNRYMLLAWEATCVHPLCSTQGWGLPLAKITRPSVTLQAGRREAGAAQVQCGAARCWHTWASESCTAIARTALAHAGGSPPAVTLPVHLTTSCTVPTGAHLTASSLVHSMRLIGLDIGKMMGRTPCSTGQGAWRRALQGAAHSSAQPWTRTARASMHARPPEPCQPCHPLPAGTHRPWPAARRQ